MSFAEAMDRALTQAREMQQKVSEAANSAAEQMKPQLQKSLDEAKALQTTLSKHAEASNEMAARQAETAMSHLNDFIRMGTEAMRASADQTRETMRKMVEESRKVVEAASDAAKTRE